MASFQIALLMEYLGNTFQRVIADGDLSHFYFIFLFIFLHVFFLEWLFVMAAACRSSSAVLLLVTSGC